MKKSFRFQIGRRMSPQEAEGQVSPCYTPRIVCGDIEIEPTRDWITEDHWHTSRITEAIDSDRHDVAWKRIHEFQEWCIERANEQRYDRRAAISLLSVPHRFFRRVLKKEGRHNEELVHLIFEAACDHRDLKYYPRRSGAASDGANSRRPASRKHYSSMKLKIENLISRESGAQ